MKRAALLIILILLTARLQAQSLDTLDASLTRIDQQRAVLMKEYDRVKKQNDDRRKRIDGGSATDADIRQAYASAANLDQLNAKLNDLNNQTQQLCDQWRTAYRSSIDSLLANAEKEPDPKKKAEAGRNLQHLQQRNAELCAQKQPADSIQWQSLQVEPYDGPMEIEQKAQLLKDIDREMTLRLARLEDQYKQSQKERRTRERAQEFVQEGTLFDQSVTIRSGSPEGAASTFAGVNTNAEMKTFAPDLPTQESAAANTDPGPDWPLNRNPRQMEEDYRKQRESLLQQQKELKTKIQDFEQKAQVLLHP